MNGHLLMATEEMARQWYELFVNRRAFTIQSKRAHAETGRHYYYRPKGADGEDGLTVEAARRHLTGEQTVGIYAINPASQRCRWVAIDADYRRALDDLLGLQSELRKDGVEAALEKSNRGGHLWIFFETPCLARACRVYINDLAKRLSIPIKGVGLPEGLEIFPRQDAVGEGEFGNAIRGPLGVHWGANDGRGRRFWFYYADYTLEAQLAYLDRVQKVTEAQLATVVQGLEIPPELASRQSVRPAADSAGRKGEFRILEYVQASRRVGRNWVTRCPSCAAANRDRAGDNLAISVEEPQKYICWAGCSREMIRAALGRPIQTRTA